MRTLGDALALLRMEDRGWVILHHRYGLAKRKTLEELGSSFGVTRERVRQIEKVARTRLKNGTLVLHDACEVLEQSSTKLGEPFEVRLTRATLLRRAGRILTTAGLASSPGERYRLVVAFRAMPEKFAKHWPKSTLLFCSLPPPIVDHPDVSSAIAEQEEAGRQWSYEELARHVLVEEGAPMHWRDLLQAAERLGRRATILPSPFFNTLGSRKETFVRVGSGTYGLLEWGLKERPTNVDLIAAYLRRKGRTATFGEILLHMGMKGGIKSNSLQMSLDLNPRFYRSIEGEYGIRVWLPPREKQTLRAPQWKVESRESYVRVERARDRGYDIEAIAARDIA